MKNLTIKRIAKFMHTLTIREGGEQFTLIPRLEGIYNSEFCLRGYELLTEVYSLSACKKINPRAFFDSICFENISAITIAQLRLLGKLAPLFRKQKILVSLNLNAKALNLAIEDPKIKNNIYSYRDFLRIEVDEEFYLSIKYNTLQDIAKLCPLWLDDYGRGDYKRQLDFLELFEVIKLDRYFINSIISFPSGKMLIKDIYNNFAKSNISILAEGVDSYDLMFSLKQSGINLFQGWLWKDEIVDCKNIYTLAIKHVAMRT